MPNILPTHSNLCGWYRPRMKYSDPGLPDRRDCDTRRPPPIHATTRAVPENQSLMTDHLEQAATTLTEMVCSFWRMPHAPN